MIASTNSKIGVLVEYGRFRVILKETFPNQKLVFSTRKCVGRKGQECLTDTWSRLAKNRKTWKGHDERVV